VTLLVGWQDGCWGAGVVICLERGADLHMSQLIPLPLTVSCFSKIQIGFAFLVPVHLGSPGKRAIKRVCVCNIVMSCHVQRFGRLRGTGAVLIWQKPLVTQWELNPDGSCENPLPQLLVLKLITVVIILNGGCRCCAELSASLLVCLHQCPSCSSRVPR